MPVGYLQGVQELNSGPPKTNPSSGREEDLNPGPPDYKTSALPLGHPPSLAGAIPSAMSLLSTTKSGSRAVKARTPKKLRSDRSPSGVRERTGFLRNSMFFPLLLCSKKIYMCGRLALPNRAQYGAAMLVYLQETPTWRPENSVNIWNLLSLSPLII